MSTDDLVIVVVWVIVRAYLDEEPTFCLRDQIYCTVSLYALAYQPSRVHSVSLPGGQDGSTDISGYG